MMALLRQEKKHPACLTRRRKPDSRRPEEEDSTSTDGSPRHARTDLLVPKTEDPIFWLCLRPQTNRCRRLCLMTWCKSGSLQFAAVGLASYVDIVEFKSCSLSLSHCTLHAAVTSFGSVLAMVVPI